MIESLWHFVQINNKFNKGWSFLAEFLLEAAKRSTNGREEGLRKVRQI